jgi:hypothetical protein
VGYWRRHGNRETTETGEVLDAPRRNSRKKVSPITVDTGKGLKGSRMAEKGGGVTHWTVGVKRKRLLRENLFIPFLVNSPDA